MQKKIIAVAVAGLVSTGAFAQTNVTVYGQMDLSINNEWGSTKGQLKNATGVQGATSTTQGGVGLNPAGQGATVDPTENGSRTAMRSGMYKASFVGFKGTEDLGGGLKADFVIESTVNADGNNGNNNGTSATSTGQVAMVSNPNDGAGLFADREATIAITNPSLGRIKIGRQENFLVSLGAASDPFLGNGPGGVKNMFILPLATTQASNSIRLDTKLGPVGIGYQISMSENQDKVNSTTSGSHTTLYLTYKEGPILFIAGQGIVRDLNSGAAAASSGRKFVGNVIGGTYDLDVAKLHATYYTAKTSSAANEINPTVDSRSYMLGLTVPMGAHSFKVSYVNTDDKRAFDMDGNSWGLGYEYDFSKRTKFYSRLAKVDNKNGAAFGVLGGGPNLVAASAALTGSGASAVGAWNTQTGAGYNRANAFNMGMLHSF